MGHCFRSRRPGTSPQAPCSLWSALTSLQIEEEKWKQWLYFLGLHCRWWLQPWNKRHLLLGRKAMTNLDSVWKSRDITLLTKVHLVKAMVFPSSHVWMLEWNHKESWTAVIWCFWTVVLEKTLKSPLECKEIKPVNPKGNYSFLGYEYSLEDWYWSSNALATWCGELTH